MELGTQDINKTVVDKLREWKNSPLQFVTECLQATPTEQQIEFLQKLPKEKRISIRSGHGCFAPNTIVHMYPYGCKTVQDVAVGDTVMGTDSTPRYVKELFTGTDTMYRIRYKDGTYYDVNSNHTLLLVCTGSKSKYTTGDKIRMTVKEFLQLPKSYHNRFGLYKTDIDFPEIPVIIPPYILGLWLGDGSHNSLEITNIDTTIIGIWQLFGEQNGLSMSTCGDKLHRLVGTNKNVVFKAFEYYNLLNNKHIPKEYLFNSRKVRLQLLAGLLDTDGYLSKENRFTITQKRKSLAEDILYLAQSCGMHATLREVVKSWVWNGEKKYDTYYEVGMYRNIEEVPMQLARKQVDEARKKQRDNLHFGFSVTEIGLGKYYGFEVDKDHTFILGDFSVVSNCGKDASSSWAILWFMVTRPYAKVACTAPTNRQLRDILMAELSKWLRGSLVADEFVIRKDIIFHKEAPKEWWIRFISPSVRATKEEQAETLAGLHSEHLLIVVDEASGVPDPTYIPLEGAMTQPDNKVILIGNMTRNSGYFYDTHFHTTISSSWCKIHWDSRKSTIVDKSMPEYFARKYGVDSDVYRIRVMGEPPLQNTNTLIPLWAAEQCIGNEILVADDEPLYLGVDVARYGDDASIILPRHGLKILPWETFRKLNTIDLGGFINQTYQEIGAAGCAIDVIGVGAGVADWLEKRNMPNLFQVNVANSSSDLEKYNRLRDELWVKVRDKCLLGMYSFPEVAVNGEHETLGQQLANELAVVRYSFNAHGGIKVESKKELKSRGIDSPNIADALCLTEYFSNTATRVFAKEKPQHIPERYAGANAAQSWMG
jgi:phage terminase large subunit